MESTGDVQGVEFPCLWKSCARPVCRFYTGHLTLRADTLQGMDVPLWTLFEALSKSFRLINSCFRDPGE